MLCVAFGKWEFPTLIIVNENAEVLKAFEIKALYECFLGCHEAKDVTWELSMLTVIWL